MKLLIAMLLLSLGIAHADDIEIRFDANADNSVRQTTTFHFTNELEGSVNYTLNEIVRDVEVYDETQSLDYRLIKSADAYVLEIFPAKPAKTITIIYTTDNAIFHSDSVSHFFTEFSFVNEMNMTVTLKLPLGYGLYQDAYRPSGAEIVSDGKRIILVWKKSGIKDILFSVKFSRLEGNILTLAVIILVALLVFLYLHLRQRTRNAFLSGFREDEKKTIFYLEKRKMALQRDLQTEFKFSRAKATRIVSILEAKGLVRKQRYGRTNKLFWLKRRTGKI